MEELRFDGRTAIVTGAGGNPGLGRAYAHLLAARGANVVVNDIGHVPEVAGYAEDALATAVVEEIRARGGTAVADTHSVATVEGANALIQTAIDAFGGVDILVNNAGICIIAPFDVMIPLDYERHMDVNVLGPTWTCRAAWPHMRQKGYGRIVNIASGGFTGVAWMAAYGTSKGGVFALTRALAAEGAPFGIKANTVNPSAFTRMLLSQQEKTSIDYKRHEDNNPAELVAPLVGYLAHESCAVNGECLHAGGGLVNRNYIAETKGFRDRELTIEKIAARWDEVMNPAGSRIIESGERDATQWNVKPYRPVL